MYSPISSLKPTAVPERSPNARWGALGTLFGRCMARHGGSLWTVVKRCINDFEAGETKGLSIRCSAPLDEVSIPSSQCGRPRKRCKWLLADKGYDAEVLCRNCDQYRMQPVSRCAR